MVMENLINKDFLPLSGARSILSIFGNHQNRYDDLNKIRFLENDRTRINDIESNLPIFQDRKDPIYLNVPLFREVIARDIINNYGKVSSDDKLLRTVRSSYRVRSFPQDTVTSGLMSNLLSGFYDLFSESDMWILDTGYQSMFDSRFDSVFTTCLVRNRELQANGIKMKKVPVCIKNNTRLRDLNLENNRIESLDFLRHVPHLESLNLSANRTINKMLYFDGLEDLSVLNASECRIKKIEGIDNLKKLKRLYLDGNYIKKIGGIDENINMEELSLSENKIKKIEGLDTNINLRELNLNRNKIEKIEGLDNNTKLSHLYLNYNKIDKIEGMDALVNLESLALQNNDIEIIENLKNQSRLVGLNLEHNKISRIEGVDGLGDLRDLNLSRNNISKIEGLEDLRGLRRLQRLDLSYNRGLDSRECSEFGKKYGIPVSCY